MVQQQPAVEAFLEELGLPVPGNPAPSDRPFITLSFAQSLDGAIASVWGVPDSISGHESLVLTHALRAQHEAILVGVGTVIADDPRLSVREWDGDDPLPVILDSGLRSPPEARLFESTVSDPRIGPNRQSPLVFYRDAPGDTDLGARRTALEARGVQCVSHDPNNLAGVLAELAGRGIVSVMVEGGGAVITSFLRARLLDRVIVTIAPRWSGGYHYEALPVSITAPRYAQLGEDLVVAGGVRWD